MLLFRNLLWLITFSFIYFSCVQQKPLVVNDPYSPGPVEEKVNDGLKVGDFISLKVNNRTFYNLEVTEINGPSIVVKQYLPDKNAYEFFEIHLVYIQELTIVDPEMAYPVGGPVTALLILFYLLV
jgi:hypothetical protein